MKYYVLVLAMVLVPGRLTAQSVSWGGFVDTYYANYFNLDAPGDAPLVTQPVRHNEFNVNLAFVEAKLSADRVRGRLALQAGTSVQSNYAGEPTIGNNGGPILARHIQEAFAGYRISENLWIDAGIFLSHIGAEGWISRDNWTYTRSLIAEYSPYYESGVKATWAPSTKLTATVAVMNGWQNISESNSNKAIGGRLDWTPSPRVALSYSNFLGNEAPEGSASRTRFFHDFIAKLTLSERVGLLGSFDFGSQDNTVNGSDDAAWYGFTAIARVQASAKVALAGRFERYSDPDGVFLSTAAGPGLETNGFSLNMDVAPAANLLWRTEFRSLIADDKVFTKSNGELSKSNAIIVSSFALTF